MSTRRSQLKTGLRVGLSAGLFLIAGILISDGMDRVVWSAVNPGQIHWSDSAGWAELLAASLILAMTADVWWQLVCGYMVFGFVKSVIAVVAGSNAFGYQGVPRAQAAFLAIFSLATILLLLRLAKDKVTIVDRVALTVFVFAFLWRAKQASFSAMSSGMVVASIVLLVAWLLAWRRGAARFPFRSLEAD